MSGGPAGALKSLHPATLLLEMWGKTLHLQSETPCGQNQDRCAAVDEPCCCPSVGTHTCCVCAQAYGVVLQPGKLSLVTELMRGGDMYHSLRHHPHLMRYVCAPLTLTVQATPAPFVGVMLLHWTAVEHLAGR
jgi:hypothetical protein